MRQLLSVLIGFLLLAGSLVATFGTIRIRDFELPGYVDATLDKDLPFAMPRPGVNVDLRQYTSPALDANLEQIAASNLVWIRQFVYWDEVEMSPGQYDWSRWDDIIGSLKRFPQLEPVVVFMNTPGWARVSHPSVEVTKTGPPALLEDFAEFVSTFASRYGDAVDYYQIWDEPNLDDAWGMLEPRPAEYVALLKAAADAIRSVDETAKIVAAGLASTTEIGGQNISELRYLDAMYSFGAASSMEIVAGKPYGFDTSPLDRRVDEGLLNFSRIVALREIMKRHGDGQKPLWASDWGWNSLPPNWTGDRSIWGSVSEDEQIRYTLQAFDRAHRELPWLGAMILQHWQPVAAPDSAQWGFALLGQDGAESRLLTAIQEHAFPSAAQNGLFHPRTEYARYSGVWQFSELGADIGWLETSDSRFEFDFYGSDLALLLREDNYIAFLYPNVDGEPANATPRDSDGNPYVFLRSNSQAPEINLVPISRDLELDRHTLSVVADRGWDRWAIAGFAVSSGSLWALYDRQIAIGGVATVLSLIVLLAVAFSAPWRRYLPRIHGVLVGISASSHLLLSGITSLAMVIALSWTWTSQRPALFVRGDMNPILAIITGGILYLSPSFLLLSIAAALFLFVLIYHRLETGLILTLFWAPFFLFPVDLYLYAMPMVEAMILITSCAAGFRFMVWLGTQYQTSNSVYRFRVSTLLKHLNAIDLALAGVVIIAFASLIWTRRIDEAITELRTLIVEPALFYVIFRALRPDKSALMRMLIALLGAALLVSVIGLVGYISGESVITAEGGARRLVSVYGSPNNVGLLLGRTLPFLLAFVLVDISRQLRIAAGVSLLIVSVALLLTQSVGALLLGTPAAIAVVLVAYAKRRAILPLIVIGIIGIIGFAVLTQLSGRFANILDFSSGTNFFRLRLWESAIEMIRNHPVTGIGLDQFLYLFSGEYVRPDAIWDLNLSHPHNFVLDFWTRLSVVGLALFAVMQLSFWRQAKRMIARFAAQDKAVRALSLGLFGSMAALLAHGLIDNSVFVIDLAFIFAFQLAMIVRLSEIEMSAA